MLTVLSEKQAQRRRSSSLPQIIGGQGQMIGNWQGRAKLCPGVTKPVRLTELFPSCFHGSMRSRLAFSWELLALNHLAVLRNPAVPVGISQETWNKHSCVCSFVDTKGAVGATWRSFRKCRPHTRHFAEDACAGSSPRVPLLVNCCQELGLGGKRLTWMSCNLLRLDMRGPSPWRLPPLRLSATCCAGCPAFLPGVPETTNVALSGGSLN